MLVFEILTDSPEVGKVRIKQKGADKLRSVIHFALLILFSIGFIVVGFNQLFKYLIDRLDTDVVTSGEQIFYTIFLSVIYAFFAPFIIFVFNNLRDLFKTIIYSGDVYEFNREKKLLLVNGRIEASLDDIERIHLRILHSSSGKDLHRLYIKTVRSRKKLICQYENYEAIHELSTFISKFLVVPVTVK